MKLSERETQFKLNLAMLMLELAGFPAGSPEFKRLYREAFERLSENGKREYAAFVLADFDALQRAMQTRKVG